MTNDLPAGLDAALAARQGGRAAFDILSYSMRKEYVRRVGSAQVEVTRTRRMAKSVGSLPE